MEQFSYKPKGTCSKLLNFEMEDDKIKSLQVVGGCPGNLLGISRIVKDMPVDQVIEAFDGVHCGGKATSCPDQIAQALKQYKQTH